MCEVKEENECRNIMLTVNSNNIINRDLILIVKIILLQEKIQEGIIT